MNPKFQINIEQYILGSILTNYSRLKYIQKAIKPIHFTSCLNRTLFSLVTTLYRTKVFIDISILVPLMQKKFVTLSQYDFVYLYELSSFTIDFTLFITLTNTLLSMFQLRTTQQRILSTYNYLSSTIVNISSLTSYIIQSIVKPLSQHNLLKLSCNTTTMLLKKTIVNILSSNMNTSLPTGYYDLDKLIKGLHPSELIILAGRPSVGKTTLLIGICKNVLIYHNVPVLFFSLEMSSTQILFRFLSVISNNSNPFTYSLTEELKPSLLNAMLTFKYLPLYIIDNPSLTLQSLESQVKKVNSLHSQKCIVVIDYLQLITTSKSYNTRSLEVSEISRTLKVLSVNLGITIIALSQMNRNIDSNPTRLPVLSDLRESGSIEQDADTVIFLHKPSSSLHQSRYTFYNLLVEKNRNGIIGTSLLIFDSLQAKFLNIKPHC